MRAGRMSVPVSLLINKMMNHRIPLEPMKDIARGECERVLSPSAFNST